MINRTATGDETWASYTNTLGCKKSSTCGVMEHGTINSNAYSKTLQKLARVIQNKRYDLLSPCFLFLHDNTPPHIAWETKGQLHQLKQIVVDHPSYNSDLAFNDFQLFMYMGPSTMMTTKNFKMV